MTKEVEAFVGCTGLLLLAAGILWAIIGTPGLADFLRSVPPWAFVLSFGLLMFLTALTNKKP